MKKIFVFLIIPFLIGCSKNNSKNIDNSSEQEYIEPSIEYVSSEATFINSNNKKMFEDEFGVGKKGNAIKLDVAKGNLISTKIGNVDVGVSIGDSNYSQGGYSAYLTYFKNMAGVDDKVETKEEFGALSNKGENIITNLSFDKLKSDSGEMLVVSEVRITDTVQRSSYYIYNKFMEKMDSLFLTNSTDNINVEAKRDSTILTENLTPQKGTMEDAIKKRVEMEDKYLEDMFKTYRINFQDIKQTINGKEMVVGTVPTESDILEKMLTIDTITNDEKLPVTDGYFNIY